TFPHLPPRASCPRGLSNLPSRSACPSLHYADQLPCLPSGRVWVPQSHPCQERSLLWGRRGRVSLIQPLALLDQERSLPFLQLPPNVKPKPGEVLHLFLSGWVVVPSLFGPIPLQIRNSRPYRLQDRVGDQWVQVIPCLLDTDNPPHILPLAVEYPAP